MLRSRSVLVPTSDVTIQRFNDHVRGSANVKCLDLTPISSLSRESQALLLKLMTESVPGAKRLKGELPAGTVVAHKTGTGDTRDGITLRLTTSALSLCPMADTWPWPHSSPILQLTRRRAKASSRG
jgi:hypothetical protein